MKRAPKIKIDGFKWIQLQLEDYRIDSYNVAAYGGPSIQELEQEIKAYDDTFELKVREVITLKGGLPKIIYVGSFWVDGVWKHLGGFSTRRNAYRRYVEKVGELKELFSKREVRLRFKKIGLDISQEVS